MPHRYTKAEIEEALAYYATDEPSNDQIIDGLTDIVRSLMEQIESIEAAIEHSEDCKPEQGADGRADI